MSGRISCATVARITGFAFGLAIMLGDANTSNAQRLASRASIGVSSHVSRQRLTADSTRSIPGATHAGGATSVRAVSAAGGFVAGAFIGGYVGANLEGPCSCDDPGLEGLILGFLTGVLVGTPLGAASPALGSSCSFGERFGRAFVGTTAGTAIGLFTVTGSAGSILVLPALSIGGGLVALGHCLKPGRT